MGLDILPMQWGNSSPEAFFAGWGRQIEWHDAANWKQGETVYSYLERKLWSILDNVKKPGQAGWAFKMARSPTLQLIHCVVWCDGTKSGQTIPLSSSSTHPCQWWPCICIECTYLVPFLCPALAWSNARPWEVHPSRLRRVSENPISSPPSFNPVSENPISSPPLFNPFHTSSVTIEEVETDDDEDWAVV